MLQINIVSSEGNNAYVSDEGRGPLIANGQSAGQKDVFGMQIESWPQYGGARVIFKSDRKFVVVQDQGEEPATLGLSTTKSGDASLFQLTKPGVETWSFQSVANQQFVSCVGNPNETLYADKPDQASADAFKLIVPLA